MSFMHAITLEEIRIVGGDTPVKGLERYHTLYLFHSNGNPGLFEISEQTPFPKERKTVFHADYNMRIVSYSTDTPILVLLDGRTTSVLMPDCHGEFIQVPVDHGVPPAPEGCDTRFIKIVGITPHHQIQFLEYSA